MARDLKGFVLGELAVRQRLLTEEQLDLCTQQQIDERYARPLGLIMIERGFIKADALDALLQAQRAAIAEFEKSAPFGELFGKIAVARGFLTEERLTQALRAQARKHARGVKAKLGQVMMELGFLSIQQFWEVIHEQSDFTCSTCGGAIERPIFVGHSIVCGNCKAPAFEVTPTNPGPKVKRRKARK